MMELTADESNGTNAVQNRSILAPPPESESPWWRQAMETEVSIFRGISPEPDKVVKVRTVLKEIAGGDHRNPIAKIRKATEELGRDHTIVKDLKKKLFVVTWAGTFNHRRETGLETYSGLLILDYDELPDPKGSKEALMDDDRVLAAWISPSGTGIKILVAADSDDPAVHSRVWYNACDYFRGAHDLKVDPGGQDLSRACFLSDDPDLYLRRPDATPVVAFLPKAKNKSIEQAGDGDRSVEGAKGDDASVEQIRKALSHIPPRPDYEDWLKITSAVFSVLPFEEAFPLLNDWSPEENPGEYKKKYKHRLTGIGVGTLFYYAQRHGYQTEDGTRGDMMTTDEENYFFLPGGPITISTSAERIFSRIAAAKELFTHAQRVVEVISNGGSEPVLSEVTPPQFSSRIEKYGKVMACRTPEKKGEIVAKPVICSRNNAEFLLNSTEATDLLPPIRAILRTPVAVESKGHFEILAEEGWHRHDGGIYLWGSCEPIALQRWDEARRNLHSLVEEFDFVTPGDRSRALAALIAPALKAGGILKTPFPLTLILAGESQTGKTFLTSLISAVYGETPAIIGGEEKRGVGSLKESLSSQIISGRPFVLLDNLRIKIESQFLELILTAPGPISCRVPYRGEIMVDPRGINWYATTNGAVTTPDLAKRSNVIRLNKKPLNYRFRRFAEGDLLAHVAANRERFVAAILTVIHFYVSVGKLSTEAEGAGAFRRWWQAVDWIVQVVLQEEPVLSGLNEAIGGLSDPDLSWLRDICHIIGRTRGAPCEVSALDVVQLSAGEGKTIPGCAPGTDEHNAAKTVGGVMARIFREQQSIALEEWRITRVERQATTSGGNATKKKFYQFAAVKNS